LHIQTFVIDGRAGRKPNVSIKKSTVRDKEIHTLQVNNRQHYIIVML